MISFKKEGNGIWSVINNYGLKTGIIIQWDRDYRIAKNRGAGELNSFYWQQEYGTMVSSGALGEIFEFMKDLEIKLTQGEL